MAWQLQFHAWQGRFAVQPHDLSFFLYLSLPTGEINTAGFPREPDRVWFFVDLRVRSWRASQVAVS